MSGKKNSTLNNVQRYYRPLKQSTTDGESKIYVLKVISPIFIDVNFVVKDVDLQKALSIYGTRSGKLLLDGTAAKPEECTSYCRGSS